MSRRRQRREDRVRVRINLHTLSLVAVVMTMAYSGAVQTNGAAYLLAFLTAVLGVLSYVHARANLRGLEILPGAAAAGQAGREGKLPITIRAASGQSPCGLELLVVGARHATLVDRIASGTTVRTPVTLPAEQEGLQQRVRLLVRSAYPLGLFSAERQMDIDCVRRVHPRPAGNLPLPEPDPSLREEATVHAGQVAQAGREGDDFAGLREWQIGDSPRHIDWRALARGRPLLVKTWAGNATDAVSLNWKDLALPAQQRSEQLAKWIEICEKRSLPYALKVPGSEVPVGLGPAHAQRCLNVLADLGARAPAAEAQNKKPPRVPASHEHSAHLPGKPLALLCVGLALAALPLWPVVAPSSLVLLALCLLARWLGGRRTFGGWIPVVVAALGIGGVLLRDGTVFTTEAGIAVLLVLQGCKLLEARSPHDFQVLSMIGWFVCLCGILAEQSLERSMYSIGVFVYILVCMIRFRRSAPGMRAPLRLGGILLAQAAPIALVLFVIFPRGTFDALARRLGTAPTTISGVPMELEPGTIAEVVASDASAFRAKFPNGQLPPNQQRYWRCVVLWDCQGLTWRRGPTLLSPPRGEYAPQPGDVRQEIDMEAHGQLWLPALDRPIRGGPQEVGLQSPGFDDTLQGRELLRRPRRVQALSRPIAEYVPLPEAHRKAALQTPASVGERMKALAEQWRKAARTDVEVVQAGLSYLQTQRFSYALDPGQFLGPGALEDFWFERRVGFCSHFSASFATMMRLSGVPCRVVMGYLGGTWNAGGGYLLVRQSDAHAWVEVWLEQSGWTRIDPTAVLVPSRLNLDLQGSLLGDEDEANRQRNNFWRRTYDDAALFWDNVSYQWDTRIIQYDEEAQLDWLGAMGMERFGNDQWRDAILLGICGVVGLAGLGVLTLWLRRPARHRDPWARAWQELCRRVAQLGLPERQASEGPLDYARRLGSSAPNLAPEVERLAAIYAGARYGEERASLKEFRRALRRLRKESA